MQRIERFSKHAKIYEIEPPERKIPTFIPNDDEQNPNIEPLPILWDIKQNDQNNNLC